MLYTNRKEPSFFAWSNSFTKWSPVINAMLIIFLWKTYNFLGWWDDTVGKSACCTNLAACAQSPDPMQKEKTGPQKLPSNPPTYPFIPTCTRLPITHIINMVLLLNNEQINCKIFNVRSQLEFLQSEQTLTWHSLVSTCNWGPRTATQLDHSMGRKKGLFVEIQIAKAVSQGVL